MRTTGVAPLPGPAEEASPPRRSGVLGHSVRWGLLATLLLLSALLGGTATVGLLAATGALSDSTATTATAASGPGTADATTAGGDDSTRAGSLDAAALYERAAPSVVTISATGASSSMEPPFPNAPGAPGGDTAATGSGFVIDTDGHLLTAAHVVDGASSIRVTFADGSERSATIAGQDDSLDAAVLKIDPSGLELQPLELGNSSAIAVGDAVAAIGDPFGYVGSLSTGIVSGLDRTIEAPNGFTVAHAVQTDTSLNPGNSGGPLLDADGRVIGIVDQIATGGSAEQSSGVGFAIPIDLVADVLDQLRTGESVEHAYLGVAATDGQDGALVQQVVTGTPAEQGGLEAGDIITEFDGTVINDSADLVAAIAGHAPDDRVAIVARRGSDRTELTVTLTAQPTSGVG